MMARASASGSPEGAGSKNPGIFGYCIRNTVTASGIPSTRLVKVSTPARIKSSRLAWIERNPPGMGGGE